MNYQEMSDRSIDLAVFQAIFGKNVLLRDADLRRKWNRGFSYCNSWADAGQIAEENEIGVVKVLNGWCATNDHAEHEGVFFVDSNPRRAICIVFLMMKGGE